MIAMLNDLVISALQHKLPAAIAGTNVCLALVAFGRLFLDHEQRQTISYLRLLIAFSISFLMASSAYRKRSVVLSGAIFGFLIAFSMFLINSVVGMSLIFCYLATNKATRYRGELKAQFEVEFKKGGQRNWVQIISNLGVANIFVLIQALTSGVGESQIDFHQPSGSLSHTGNLTYTRSGLLIAAVSSIACALGDTLSSELGPVWSGDQEPLLILDLRPVPKGTNGGVTIAGLLAAVLGGSIIGLGAWSLQCFFGALEPTTHLSGFVEHWVSPQWPIIAFGIYAGLFGSIVDSVIGALFQYTGYDRMKRKVVETPPVEGGDSGRRVDKDGLPIVEHITGRYWLDNHDVNCLSIVITGLFTPLFASQFWPSGVAI